MLDFRALGLSLSLLESLDRMGITAPTPVQQQAIPLALQGIDLLASAQTGSGKTIAYLIPLLVNLSKSLSNRSKALILVPTRELAIQVKDALSQIISSYPGFYSTVLIGGEPIGKQLFQLRREPRIIIATPGRLCDHLDRGSITLDGVEFLVLDETDRMLDMGFSKQLERVCQDIPEQRQTLMFSATLPPHIKKLSSSYLKNPQYIAIGSSFQAAADIKQEIVHTSMAEKFPRLLQELEQREGAIIVFVKTKRGAGQLAMQLKGKNHSADAIHGDLQQRKREQVVQAFRKQKNRIMVATDIAARGLDIPHIQHVINYDLPGCPEDYIHRIGRTGRAGSKGCALSLVSPEDTGKWKRIYRLMNPKEGLSESENYGYERSSRGGGNRGGNSYSRGSSNGGSARSSNGGGSSRKDYFSSRPSSSPRTNNSTYSKDSNYSSRDSNYSKNDDSSSSRDSSSYDDNRSSGSRGNKYPSSSSRPHSGGGHGGGRPSFFNKNRRQYPRPARPAAAESSSSY